MTWAPATWITRPGSSRGPRGAWGLQSRARTKTNRTCRPHGPYRSYLIGLRGRASQARGPRPKETCDGEEEGGGRHSGRRAEGGPAAGARTGARGRPRGGRRRDGHRRGGAEEEKEEARRPPAARQEAPQPPEEPAAAGRQGGSRPRPQGDP